MTTSEPIATAGDEAAPAGEPGNASRDAAKYRARLREVEAERDALAAKISDFEQGETARARTDLLDRISDETGVPVEMLVGGDETELRAHAERMNAWRPAVRSVSPEEAAAGNRATVLPKKPNWADAIGGDLRGDPPRV